MLNLSRKRIALGVVGVLVFAVVADEARVRWRNHEHDRAWQAQVSKNAAAISGFATTNANVPSVRNFAIGDVFDARSDGRQTIFLSLKDIERQGASYRDDAEHIFRTYFSGPPWREASFTFSGMGRSGLVRAKSSNADGSTRFWFIDYKRLGSRVAFVFLDKGASDPSYTEFAASRIAQSLVSESDDGGGVPYVECSLCQGRVRELDQKGFPLLWIAQDRTTLKAVPRSTPLEQAGLAPVCGRCAKSLPAGYVVGSD